MTLLPTFETRIFQSESDYIVIHQTGGLVEGEGQSIVLSAWQARQIAKEISRLVKQMPDNPSSTSDE